MDSTGSNHPIYPSLGHRNPSRCFIYAWGACLEEGCSGGYKQLYRVNTFVASQALTLSALQLPALVVLDESCITFVLSVWDIHIFPSIVAVTRRNDRSIISKSLPLFCDSLAYEDSPAIFIIKLFISN